jgi:hypothetical protein
MNIGTVFPSKYLKSADIAVAGRPVPVVIDRIEIHDVGGGDKQEDKPVLFFRGKEKGMVMNITNANAISEVYGAETDDWIGQTIELYVAKVQFQNRMVDAIRIQVPRHRPAPPPAPVRPAPSQRQAPPPNEPPYGDEQVHNESDIPF